MKYIVMELTVWKWQGAIACGGTANDFAAFAKSQGASNMGDDSDPHSAGRAYVELGVPWLLWVESLADVPALAHEALHVTSGVLEARGLRHVPQSEEAYTYTMESILRVALNEQAWASAETFSEGLSPSVSDEPKPESKPVVPGVQRLNERHELPSPHGTE